MITTTFGREPVAAHPVVNEKAATAAKTVVRRIITSFLHFSVAPTDTDQKNADSCSEDDPILPRPITNVNGA
jgi:hypothetical protein